jgi:hypothetical protein
MIAIVKDIVPGTETSTLDGDLFPFRPREPNVPHPEYASSVFPSSHPILLLPNSAREGMIEAHARGPKDPAGGAGATPHHADAA